MEVAAGIPQWVSEGSIRKYHRAVATLTREKKAITEEAIKELYVKDGGLVLGEPESVKGAEPGTEETLENRAIEAQGKTEAPAKKGKGKE